MTVFLTRITPAVKRHGAMTTMRDFLMWYNNRDVVPFLEAIDKYLPFYKRQLIDMFKDGIGVHRCTPVSTPSTTYFTLLNEKNNDLHRLVKDSSRGLTSFFIGITRKRSPSYTGTTTLRPLSRVDRSLVTTPTVCTCGLLCKTCRISSRISVAARTGRSIRHHGCLCTQQEVNTIKEQLKAWPLTETRKNTAYLRHFVTVVELWEYAWKEAKKDPAVKRCLDAAFPVMQQQMLAAVRDATLFCLIECDVHVTEKLHAGFAEMQPVFKNASVTRDDLGPFMRRYAEEHAIMMRPQDMLVGNYNDDKILFATPMVYGTRTRSHTRVPDHRIRTEPVLSSVR